MKEFLKTLAEHKFNLIDLTFNLMAVSLIANHAFIAGIITVVLGTCLSVYMEHSYGK